MIPLQHHGAGNEGHVFFRSNTTQNSSSSLLDFLIPETRRVEKKMIKIFCAMLGKEGSAFPVDIDVGDTVGDLQDAIMAENEDMKGPAHKLQLFLAKKQEGRGLWLTEEEVMNGWSDTVVLKPRCWTIGRRREGPSHQRRSCSSERACQRAGEYWRWHGVTCVFGPKGNGPPSRSSQAMGSD
jgi:hypothetical protein